MGPAVSGSGQKLPSSPSGLPPTDFTYTGQRDVGLGLVHYGAANRAGGAVQFRVVSETAERSGAEPLDRQVPEPGNPQDLNRFAYVRNNPLRHVDPSGHMLINGGCSGNSVSWACRFWHNDPDLVRRGVYGSGEPSAPDAEAPPRRTSYSQLAGVTLELAGKPSNWVTWWRWAITGELTDEEFVNSIDYEGTRMAVKAKAGLGSTRKGLGVKSSYNPDDTVEFGAYGTTSMGPLSAGIEETPSLAWTKPGRAIGWKASRRNLRGSIILPGGYFVRAGRDRYGNYAGVGASLRVEEVAHASIEVDAYGGVVDRAVVPVADKAHEAYWGAAYSCYMLGVIGSYHILGPEHTRQLFFD